jgi:hypothetical protein
VRERRSCPVSDHAGVEDVLDKEMTNEEVLVQNMHVAVGQNQWEHKRERELT